MKNLLLLFTAFGLFASCGDDDASTSALPNDYQSSITIDGVAFTPSPATASESHVVTSASHGAPNVSERTFVIRQAGNNTVFKGISLYTNYTGTNASGTYTVYPAGPVENEFTGGGSYMLDDMVFPFNEGSTFKVTDLGNNKFKIELNNIHIGDGIASPMIINGTFEGTFTDMPLEP
ncbi:hypothetical protein FMM05_09475 [Flavobacterium zepuense]|uniref:Lipoprotein n=1 Tax=Flavobacterium zepuense TaxID=2593302 RepID=A0A552V2N5_9FLAO|nr:hypothetical protein [Flavobacterium zepuense]TRW24725.1 hypothetical protein FMM05_09475 [Flavobacterium zepuense]